MRAAGLDTSKQDFRDFRPSCCCWGDFYTVAQLMFSRSRQEYFKKCVCMSARHKGRTRFLLVRCLLIPTVAPSSSFTTFHLRGRRDERAEHGAHLLNPPGGTLNRPRRLEREGTQGAVTFKKKELWNTGLCFMGKRATGTIVCLQSVLNVDWCRLITFS